MINVTECSQDVTTVADVRKQLELFNDSVLILGWDRDSGVYTEIAEIDIQKIMIDGDEKYCVVISMEGIE
jgi:hypothetical protein